MKLLMIVALLASPAAASWSGKLDMASPPSLGAWQSLKSSDQAFGLSKRVFHVDSGEQAVINVGLFGGVSKPLLSEPASAPHALGGLTFAVPGAVLDWVLGTSWGDAWLPKLKTGVLCAYDFSRIAKLGPVPGFIGIGVSYPLGGGL